jgi:hypothetical protein
VVVANLTRGTEHRAHVWPGPRFRVSLPADVDDQFNVRLLDPAGHERALLTSWSADVWYGRAPEPTYRAGDPLRTPTDGFGLARCTPDLRRLVNLFQTIIDPADPAAWARHYFQDPLDIRPEGRRVTNLLQIATVGDQAVPINTQAAIGRAAGIIESLREDPRYGLTPNDWLIQKYVYEGLARLARFPGTTALFDPDDLDRGQDGFGAPEPAPSDRLLLKVPTDTGVSGVRFAYLDPHGQHGIFIPSPQKAFDMDTYVVNLIGRFFASAGTEILDDTCLEDSSCGD